MFSMTTEYALRAAVFLGDQDGDVQTSQKIAEATRTPARYASRVLHLLVEAGIASSQRGPSGGFQLTRAPEDITLLQVVQAVEPFQRRGWCPPEPDGDASEMCPLYRAMTEVASCVTDKLGHISLADVAHRSGDAAVSR